jgi:hypothetical protein
MVPINRRTFLAAPGAMALVRLPLQGQSNPATSPAPVPADVTRTLARYVLSAKKDDLPAKIRHDASRTLLNYVGCALGGSHHETVSIAISALSPFSGPAQASISDARSDWTCSTHR